MVLRIIIIIFTVYRPPMIMIRKLHKKNQYLVTLLLVGFISVFLCDALCDFELISWGNSPVIVQEVEHHPVKGHDHDHHDAASDPQHHDKQDNDEDECCDEMVTNLYASLIKYELKQNAVEIPVFHLLYQVYAINFQVETFNQKPLLFLYTNLPPPVIGYHIRIFIQSYLI